MPRSRRSRANPNANDSSSSSSNASEEYDWNVKSRLLDVLHRDRQTADQGDQECITIEWGEDDLPEDGETLELDKVNKFSLNHGDLLRFDDYRFSQAYFVYRTHSGNFKLIENPDEGGSGYLTIPVEVVQNVTDAVDKFNDIIKESSSVLMHVSNDDKFVKDQLGEGIPSSWAVVVSYIGGEFDIVCVQQGDTTWETSEWENASVDDIKSYFSGADEPNTKFLVKIDLKGDKFKEYKVKFATNKKATAWLSAFPKLPKTWSVEKGETGMGSDHYMTKWTCKGPTNEKDEVKSCIMEFFEGFEFSVEEQAA